MFRYSLRTKIFLSVALISLIILVLVIVSYNFGKSKDLRLVGQLKNLAISYEKYYDKYDRYPTTNKINVSNIAVISENGINERGGTIYFDGRFDWAGEATIKSDDQNYLIEFELDNSWKVWEIDSFDGGKCRLGNNVVMKCINKE